jgi:hypothetical protein
MSTGPLPAIRLVARTLLSLAIAALMVAVTVGPAAPTPLTEKPAAAPDPGDRTRQLLRYSCGNPLGHREITLFANGTVRLRDGEPGKEWMGLAELDPEALEGAANRLAAEDLRDAEGLPSGMDGTWVERCELELELAGKPLKKYAFGRYDTLPLSLSKIVRIADELSTQVLSLKEKEELPVGYEPRIGDVIKRVDNRLFRIEGFTSDGKGVELSAVDDPLGLYVPKDRLPHDFVALISRAKK